MELHICKQCGLVAPKGTTVCPRCGRALPPTKAEASRPRYTIHVDPDMVQYWDDEDEDEFPLKEDPFFMWYGKPLFTLVATQYTRPAVSIASL